MTKINELINKHIDNIKFNGCNLTKEMLTLMFDGVVALAKLQESIDRNQKYLESFKLDTAHGNGGNDLPNVIGDMITEPEQVGRWYKCVDGSSHAFTANKWYFCPSNNPLTTNAFTDNIGQMNGYHPLNSFHFDLHNPQLNNPDAETDNYINPITN